MEIGTAQEVSKPTEIDQYFMLGSYSDHHIGPWYSVGSTTFDTPEQATKDAERYTGYRHLRLFRVRLPL